MCFTHNYQRSTELFKNKSKNLSIGLVSNLNYSINEFDIPIDNAPVYWSYAGLHLGAFFSYSFDYFGIKIEPLTFGVNIINHPKLVFNGETLSNHMSDFTLSYKPELTIFKKIGKSINIKAGTSMYIANPIFKSESSGQSMNVKIINLNIFLGVEYYF